MHNKQFAFAKQKCEQFVSQQKIAFIRYSWIDLYKHYVPKLEVKTSMAVLNIEKFLSLFLHSTSIS